MSLYTPLVFVLGLVAALFVATRLGVAYLENQYPPKGAFIEIGERRIHYLDTAPEQTDKPVVIVLHGASGNLRDGESALRDALETDYRVIFLDRPGHGWSRGNGNSDSSPNAQADIIADLMSALKIEKAVIAGHSWAGSVTASFGLRHPDRCAGLVFMAPATHPWPGGIAWYYSAGSTPLIGHLFTELISLPVGLLIAPKSVVNVFRPGAAPDDYVDRTGILLALRPANFRANARDVANLYDHVVKTAPRYPEIACPAKVITGDSDGVVYAHIHSDGLARDLQNASLIRLPQTGHMPHHTSPETVREAIASLVSGDPVRP